MYYVWQKLPYTYGKVVHCKISKKLCASILYALKYQYKIDHTHVYGSVKIVDKVHFACTHGVMIDKAHYKTARR